MIFSGITFNPSDVCTLKRFGNGVFLNLLNVARTDTNTLKEVYANEQSAEQRLVALSSVLSSYGIVNTIEDIRVGAQAVMKIESANKKTTTITFRDNTTIALKYNEDDILRIASKMQPSGGGGEVAVELTKDITFTAAVGGIAKGTTFLTGTPLEDVLERLGSVYEAPSITLATSAPALAKIGTSIATTTMTARVTKGSAALTKVNFYVNNASVYTIDITSAGNYSYTYDVAISDNATFKATVLDETGVTKSATAEVKFVRPFYNGVSDTAEVSSLDGLNEVLAVKSAQTVRYTADNKYLVFAYDKSYGNLKKILDENDFQNLDDWTKSTVGDYFVYVSNTPATITNYNYKFEF